MTFSQITNKSNCQNDVYGWAYQELYADLSNGVLGGGYQGLARGGTRPQAGYRANLSGASARGSGGVPVVRQGGYRTGYLSTPQIAQGKARQGFTNSTRL